MAGLLGAVFVVAEFGRSTCWADDWVVGGFVRSATGGAASAQREREDADQRNGGPGDYPDKCEEPGEPRFVATCPCQGIDVRGQPGMPPLDPTAGPCGTLWGEVEDSEAEEYHADDEHECGDEGRRPSSNGDHVPIVGCGVPAVNRSCSSHTCRLPWCSGWPEAALASRAG